MPMRMHGLCLLAEAVLLHAVRPLDQRRRRLAVAMLRTPTWEGSEMICGSCNGTGESIDPKNKDRVFKCFECNGTGELCDYCGESTTICEGECAEEDG
jgi:hypothetical protein